MRIVALPLALALASAVTLVAAVVILLPARAGSEETQDGRFSPYVDASGNITRPTDVRQGWEHLGTYFVPDDEHARGPGVHDVYAEPGVAEAYLETGEWPDGAALVKEIRSIETQDMTTGTASFAGEPLVWFVMIKDREGRFSDNPIWGEGWGWALYKAEEPSVNVNEDWMEGDLSNCYGCHIPAEATDWVFVEGYPTLR